MRRLLLLAFVASTVLADPRQEIYDLVASMASGLSEGNAEQFLNAFDPSIKGYDDLARNVRALVEQMEVVSTIELVEDAGDDRQHTVTVDWLLQIVAKQDQAVTARRQQSVKIRLEKQIA